MHHAVLFTGDTVCSTSDICHWFNHVAGSLLHVRLYGVILLRLMAFLSKVNVFILQGKCTKQCASIITCECGSGLCSGRVSRENSFTAESESKPDEEDELKSG